MNPFRAFFISFEGFLFDWLISQFLGYYLLVCLVGGKWWKSEEQRFYCFPSFCLVFLAVGKWIFFPSFVPRVINMEFLIFEG